MLAAVCLDLMDTVVHDPFREAIAAGAGAPLTEIMTLMDRDAWPDFELGRIDEDTFAARFFRDGVARRLDIDALNEARRAGYAPLPGMLRVLDDLRGRTERHLASNYPVWIADVLDACDLSDRVEGVHVSFEVGARKPDPMFFTALIERIGHPPGACLFVDDRPDNCSAASAAGFRTHVFGGAADLRARLVDEGALRA